MITIILIVIAGPVIGSLIGVIKRPTNFFINNFLAFAAGIMLSISFLQLIPQSIRFCSLWICCLGIIIGSLVMYGLDKLIPHTDPEGFAIIKDHPLRKTAIYLLIGIALHHFPEGMAIALGTVAGYKMSLSIALAIAIHDIPEGVCTSAPYYYLAGKRLKAFLISSSTAIPTIVGYLFARFLFQNIPTPIIGFVVASTAGLMIYICADELIPTACRKDSPVPNHSTIFFLITGILFVIMLEGLLK